ncbi:hypothetical protein LCGC14_0805280 [marine sediment metagenome]|uniref:Transglycosylase SLT domain-containing protein n=1 Tax=marine sediment metagenome TaxID=412755 RepID=A0A0F9SVP1_9ZZZZ
MERFRYIFLGVFMAVMFLVVDAQAVQAIGYPRQAVITRSDTGKPVNAGVDLVLGGPARVKPAYAIEYPRQAVITRSDVAKPINNGVSLILNSPFSIKPVPDINDANNKPKASLPTIKQYRYTPPEDKNVITFVNPPRILAWQMGRIVRWKYIVDDVLARNDYPYATDIIVLGIIAQESQGDNYAECNDFDTKRGTCAIGLMALTPGNCGLTAEQLKNPAKNIECGTRIINQIIEQAIEKGFQPGRDATRAAMAAYNCSWASLLADRCYSFGGWTYSDKVDYWTRLLQDYLGAANEN